MLVQPYMPWMGVLHMWSSDSYEYISLYRIDPYGSSSSSTRSLYADTDGDVYVTYVATHRRKCSGYTIAVPQYISPSRQKKMSPPPAPPPIETARF